ncbi:MAG: hypothetical protein AAB250_05205, partial [Bdellovibrionota bacterium]
MQKFILCLVFLVVGLAVGFTTSRANAEPQSKYSTIITYDEFKALDLGAQNLYVEGLRTLFDDWSKLQARDKMQFQNVGLSKPSALVALANFFDAANAAGPAVDQRQCAYAGFISEMDVNGRYCMSREKCRQSNGTLKAGWVQCNALVYGPNVCAPQGGSAS